MDPFSYLSVLLSIIIGLAITQILQGFRGIVLSRARVQLYWPTIVWSVVLLLINVQSWWAMFGMRDIQDWMFPSFCVVLSQTIIQYLLAGIVLPDFVGDKAVDLRQHYWEHTHWFFGLMVLVLLISVAKDFVLTGRLPSLPNLSFHVCFIVPSAVAMLTGSETYHKWFSVFAAALFSGYIIALFARLQ